MAQNDDLVMRTLLEIKEDIGGLSSDVKSVKESVKESLVKNDDDHAAVKTQIQKMESTVALIPGHIQSVKDMEVRLDERIGKIEADVKTIKETDLPAIKDQLVIGKWLASGRNKVLALVGVGLLGAAGNAAAGLIKDNVKVSIVHPTDAPSIVPAASALPHPVTVTERDAVDLDTDTHP